MTVDEIKEASAQLENAVIKLIKEFEKRERLRVVTVTYRADPNGRTCEAKIQAGGA